MEFLILIFLLIIALLLETRFKFRLYNSLPERLAITVVTFVTISGWELLNRHIYHAWYYPGHGLIGVKIFDLPLELYMFALIAPYFSFVIYELINKYL